jgi:hypothetical protein
MLIIVGGLIIAIGTIIIIWDVLMLVGAIAVVIVAACATAILWILGMLVNLYQWKKDRSEQRWESAQTEVYGDEHARTQYEHTSQNTVKMSMSVEDTMKLLINWKGDIVINVTDDECVRPMRDITPRRKMLR